MTESVNNEPVNEPAFDFEFHHELPNLSQGSANELRIKARDELLELAGDHNDMIGASVVIERVASGETPHAYRAQIVAYMRPDNLAAQAKGEDLEGTLSEALDALIRQVRKRRAKLGRRWEQP